MVSRTRTSATSMPSLLPALTPARCCWPDETTLALSSHSPEITENQNTQNRFIKLERTRVRIGLPRANAFYPENATTELTEGPMYYPPSVAINQSGVGGQTLAHRRPTARFSGI